ncbi:MAG: hypothetical protein GYA02_03495 [Clostridiaceae bacterium]|jgi:hypothetical protein|nr:hypothetical protein [Clostridiaceae bacterium]
MKAKQYIREIIQRSCLPARERKELKIDLENEICSALERGESIEQIIERMGDPDEVAAEIYENFTDNFIRPFREYKSERKLFGLPLVHIIRANYAASVPHFRTVSTRGVNIGGRYDHMSYVYRLPTARGVFAFGPKAKGIIAIGNLSAGFISIGNISTGLISIGNLSAGLFSLGNMALAILVTFGNLVAGTLAAGNAALGYASAGNFVLGKFAIGNETMGTHTFSVSNLYIQLDAIKTFFRELSAPAPVKAFFGVIEKLCGVIANPMSSIPFFIILSLLLLIVTLTLYIVPNRLLMRKSEPN